MNAVGKLGSYISKSVYTVSGPFHPFGGAVDIIVVEQEDGSFKSSPWYVKFGKFQGVLKAKEKLVSINVDGVDSGFNMYLDHKGEAYFLREMEVEEGEALAVLSPSSSGEDTDGQTRNRRPMKTRSWHSDAQSEAQVDVCNENVLTRTNSKRSGIVGLMIGTKSMKENRFSDEGNVTGVVRAESLERAEIAADLLEVKWSTNLASNVYIKHNALPPSAQDMSKDDMSKDMKRNDGGSNSDSAESHYMKDSIDSADADHNFPSRLGKHETIVKETGVEIPSLVSKHDVQSFTLNRCCKEDLDEHPSVSVKTDNRRVHNKNVVDVAVEISRSDLETSDYGELEACGKRKLVKEPNGYSDASLLKEEDGVDKIESSIYSETSNTQTIELKDYYGDANGSSCLSCGGCGEVCVHSDLLLVTTESALKVNSHSGNGTLKDPLDIREILVDENCTFYDEHNLESEGISPRSIIDSVITKACAQVVTFHRSDEGVGPRGVFSISSISNSTTIVQGDRSVSKEDGNSHIPIGESVVLNILHSEISKEEQLLFGDFDDFTLCEDEDLDFVSLKEEELPPSHLQRETETAYESSILKSDIGTGEMKDIPKNDNVQHKEVARMARSLPNTWSVENMNSNGHALDCSLDSSSEIMGRRLLQEDDLGSLKSRVSHDDQSTRSPKELENKHINQAVALTGDRPKSLDATNGSWKMWPFPLKRSGSMKGQQPAVNCSKNSDAEDILKSPDSPNAHRDLRTVKVTKKKIKALTPTSEQLGTLNLKQGRNTVTFTFSTSMLGKQQVDARIYLWRWDTRVVISDVDGTITRSDVLGQFMPLVGVDWSQTGVTHLFSAIKENGYQLLFLSARAISQAYHTRQFLFNLKQDGKSLPDGPVVISPDGLFPSLFREVVRRAPHEFKIACLEDIKALFPRDSNPFYAGFGNRDTDELSYLKVGIPKGKIFIINPKGEIFVNRHINTKSYTSLHALVNGVFPPTSSSEQEDFNSWNYWKLPPAAINI